MHSAASQSLIDFIQSSPTPFHAATSLAERLQAAGYQRLDEVDQRLTGSAMQDVYSYSKRGGAIENQPLATLWMIDFQAGGMQGEPRAGVECGALCVQTIAQQRVANAEHVHA